MYLLRKIRLLQLIIIIVIVTFIGYFTLSTQHPTWLNSSFLRTNQGDNIDCSPHSNIVFLKTHKCASSTIQNIVMRYGYINNKTFVLPKKANYLGYRDRFTKDLVPDPKAFNASYNILTHHTRFNFQEMQSLMPNDTIFISILREPVLLFESLFSYYGMKLAWNFDFNKFNDKNWKIPDKVSTKRLYDKFGINQMMHDMGFNATYFHDEQKILSYIDELDKTFSLVMLSERMSESLILLKNLLCWSYDDVVVLNVNARNDEYKTNITTLAYQRIERLNKADVLLYKYFSRKFNEKVKTFGEDRMKEEVKILKEKTEILYKECVRTTSTSQDKTIKFVVSNENNLMCKLITASELLLTDFIRKDQLMKHPGSVFD